MTKPIGESIKERRLKLGLTREELGRRVGCTGQTILNLERDPDYNLGMKTLRRLGEELGVEIQVTITEKAQMPKRIRLGNDELVLHIRKHYDCPLDNQVIGRRIWEWLEANTSATQLRHRYAAPYMVGAKDIKIPAVSGTGLAQSSVIIDMALSDLPGLFGFIAELAGDQKPESAYPRP